MRLKTCVATMLLAICALCAASVVGYDMASVLKGIERVESNGNPYSINDNSTRRSYKFGSKAEAVKMAKYLLSLDHNIDMGQFQINSIQLKRGWSVEDVFESSFSRRAAETVLTEWVNAAKKLYGDTVLGWQRAIGAYNSGGVGLRNGNPTYTANVMLAMGLKEAPLDKGEASLAGGGSKSLLALKSGDEDDEDEDEELGADDLDLAKDRTRSSGADEVVVGLVVAAVTVALLYLGAPGFKALMALIRVSVGFGMRVSRMTRGEK